MRILKEYMAICIRSRLRPIGRAPKILCGRAACAIAFELIFRYNLSMFGEAANCTAACFLHSKCMA